MRDADMKPVTEDDLLRFFNEAKRRKWRRHNRDLVKLAKNGELTEIDDGVYQVTSSPYVFVTTKSPCR